MLTDGANPGVTSLYTNTTAAAVRATIGAGTGDGLVTSLTTTGTSGAATLSNAGVLNIPNYADGNDNDYLTGLAFNTTNGILTATVQNQSDVTVDLDGRYLTSYTETDTLQNVCSRGSTTSTSITHEWFWCIWLFICSW